MPDFDPGKAGWKRGQSTCDIPTGRGRGKARFVRSDPFAAILDRIARLAIPPPPEVRADV